MATTRGPVSTEVDSNPTILAEGQGFRPLVAATSGIPVDTTMSLGPARHVQLSPLQQHLGAGGSHLTLLGSPHLSAQRPGNPRQQMVSPGLKVSRSQVEIRRRAPTQEEISRVHQPIVTRPVANMGQPRGPVLGKPTQGLMLHRSPQENKAVPVIQKPSPARQVIQRAHTRTAGWQTPLGQHTTPTGTPSGQQSRMFHPVLNSQPRGSPQEQARQHPVLPQQFPQQPQLRDVGPTGIKSLPVSNHLYFYLQFLFITWTICLLYV